jgi:NAD(P)-dependent dehydrogenase (short-subunit alcohol dehydrogenase family)
MTLAGKVAIVTGGSSGIGAAIARAYANEGADVVIADIDLAQAERLASEFGSKMSVARVDVTEVASIRSSVAGVMKSHGHIDILVNSAGVVLKSNFLETEPEQYDRVMAINLRGTYFFGQAVAREMVGHGGRIINIASIAGFLGFSTRSVYGSTKAAVMQLTRVMAVELAPHAILVNAIAPGPVETPLVAAAYDDTARTRVLSRIPINRFGQTEDITGIALFLASPTSSYVTGQTITIDGGCTALGLMAF